MCFLSNINQSRFYHFPPNMNASMITNSVQIILAIENIVTGMIAILVFVGCSCPSYMPHPLQNYTINSYLYTVVRIHIVFY